jgi:5,10-methylenetetrahydromethanopterin reductase
MMKFGINLIPDMPVDEVVETIRAAEELGYEICLLADEGFMPDVYVTLTAAAQKTSRIMLGPVTNGYTRHPAVTAITLASLNELSGGRVLTTLVAGGSVVLDPMGIPLEKPFTVVRESITIMRKLWAGDTVEFDGKRFNLHKAKMRLPEQDIPIWMAVRGPKMLALAGEVADGIVLMGKSDLGPALEIVGRGEAKSGRRIDRIFLERIAYKPTMLEESTIFFGHVIMDMPVRQRRSFLSNEEFMAIEKAYEEGGGSAVTRLLTPEMLKRYKIAGTIPECIESVREISNQHQLDVFLLNLTGGDVAKNIELMQDTLEILNQAQMSL